MWTSGEYAYNEFSAFGLKASLDLRNGLRECNPDIEMDGALYAMICILNPGLEALPAAVLPLDEVGQERLSCSVIECFGRERPFSFVRAGRTIVLIVRTETAVGSEREGDFARGLASAAMNFHYSIEDNIG